MITVPALAEAAGVSVYRLLGMLERSGIPYYGGGRGRAREVRLSELRRIDPDLWDSIAMASEP